LYGDKGRREKEGTDGNGRERGNRERKEKEKCPLRLWTEITHLNYHIVSPKSI